MVQWSRKHGFNEIAQVLNSNCMRRVVWVQVRIPPWGFALPFQVSCRQYSCCPDDSTIGKLTGSLTPFNLDQQLVKRLFKCPKGSLWKAYEMFKRDISALLPFSLMMSQTHFWKALQLQKETLTSAAWYTYRRHHGYLPCLDTFRHDVPALNFHSMRSAFAVYYIPRPWLFKSQHRCFSGAGTGWHQQGES